MSEIASLPPSSTIVEWRARPSPSIDAEESQSGTEVGEDAGPTPTHNAALCEICQLNLQHLSLPMSGRSLETAAPISSNSAHGTTAASPSFEDGVKLGLRLQKESDDVLLNVYRKRLQRTEVERDMSRRYRFEVERLERELEEAKDMLLATQISYAESVVARKFQDTDTNYSGIHKAQASEDDSASQLTLEGSDTAADEKLKDNNSHGSPGQALIQSLRDATQGQSPTGLEEEDDDDLFMWEQLKSLDDGNQEEFWKSVYSLNKSNAEDPRPADDDDALEYVDDADSSVHNRAEAVNGGSDTKATTAAKRTAGQDGDHSDSEDSSYSFI